MLDVLRLSTDYLERHGSSTARLDAQLLCADALGLRRIDLYLQHDRPLRDEETDGIRERVRRRARGEPVAHIVGVREFWGRSFLVTPDVLVPRPDTETLVEAALRHLDPASEAEVTVADLGTGSGCLAVTLAAERPDIRVIAVDVDPAALSVARRNAARHDVDDRVRFVQASWGDGIDEPVDIVVSNPPYVTTDELAATAPDVREHEPRLALDGGADGLAAYRALLPSLAGRLRPAARVLLEVDPRRAEEVAHLVAATFTGAGITRVPDLTGRTRVLECAVAA